MTQLVMTPVAGRKTFSMLPTYVIIWLTTLVLFFLLGWIFGRGTVKLPDVSAPERYVPAAVSEPVAENPPLREEDLNFKEALQSEGTANIVVAGLNKKKAETLASAMPAKPKPAEAAPENPKDKAPAAAADTAKYEFTVRVATYKNKDMAERFRDRLDADDYRTSIVTMKSGKTTLYCVQVRMRGTTDKVNASREELKSYGIQDTMIVGKKPMK
ncbi:MAG: SPOR domain-containing protein [Mailhella sp.]|nr:SPOR domain-containing protein [Mailhella sp.]